MAAPSVKVSRSRTAPIADVLPFMPPIGIKWPLWGGIHVAALDEFSLVMGPHSPSELDWNDADQWARSLRIGAHADFQLPTIFEVQLMVRVLPTHFAVRRLWSCDQIASMPAGDVWVHDFGTDSAVPWGRQFKNIAVAIRHEPIQWRST